MAEHRPVIHVSTPAVVITVVVTLVSLVALAAINAGVAIVLVIFAMIFGGELLDRVTTGLPTETSSPTEPATTDDEDALEVLRRRYAAGDLSDAEFDRKLETLLATETAPDVERYVGENRDSTVAGSSEDEFDPVADLESEPDLERR